MAHTTTSDSASGCVLELLQHTEFLILFSLPFKYFIYLFFAVLGLYCCTLVFSGFGQRGYSLADSVRVSHCGGFSCCRAPAQEL